MSFSLLVIVGEYDKQSQRNEIVTSILSGLKTWNGIENEGFMNELSAFLDSKPSVSYKREIDLHSVSYTSDLLTLKILIRPNLKALRHVVLEEAASSCSNTALVYGGLIVEGSGHWFLNDSLYSADHLARHLKCLPDNNPELESRVHIACCSLPDSGDWKHLPGIMTKLGVNYKIKHYTTNGALHESPQVESVTEKFGSYLSDILQDPPSNDAHPIKSEESVPPFVASLSFDKPTVYIFPSGSTDACLLGVDGFNILLNSGYTNTPEFSKFVSRIDRIDSLLMTHWSASNIRSTQALLDSNRKPPCSYFLHAPGPNSKQRGVPDTDGLLVNIIERSNSILRSLNDLSIPHSDMQLAKSVTSLPGLQPIQLYNKLGHGQLDLYCLSPTTDDPELKHFIDEWSKAAKTFTPAQSGKGCPSLPALYNASNTSVLLVWRPASPDEPLRRFLYSSGCHQTKVLSALEALVDKMPFLQYPTAIPTEIEKVKAASKNRAPSASN